MSDRYLFEHLSKRRRAPLPRLVVVKVTDTGDSAFPYAKLYALAFSNRGARQKAWRMIRIFESRYSW